MFSLWARPSWPLLLRPQQRTRPPTRVAQVWESKELTSRAAAPSLTGGKVAGCSLSPTCWLVARPVRPYWGAPQQRTVAALQDGAGVAVADREIDGGSADLDRRDGLRVLVVADRLVEVRDAEHRGGAGAPAAHGAADEQRAGREVGRLDREHPAALHARLGAAVVVDGVAVVALLDARVHEAVAAHGALAAGHARVGVGLVAVVALLDALVGEAVAAGGALARAEARVGAGHVAVVALLAVARLDEPVAARRLLAREGAGPGVVVVRAEVTRLGGLDEPVAAGGELAHGGAAVVVAHVAVVAGLGRALVAVAADVELARGEARLARAVRGAVVALLDAGVEQPVAAGRVLAGRRARAAVAVQTAEVARLAGARLHEAVAAGRELARVGAAVVVVAVGPVVARLAGVDDPVAAALELALRRTAVAVVAVAVVALLRGAHVAVAAHVEGAQRGAQLPGAVLQAVVALLGAPAAVEQLAVAAHVEGAVGGARGVVGVVDAVVARLEVVRLDEPVAARRGGARVGARVVVRGAGE
jgi:hypothetical protein